jgi:hypothetical protein
VIKDRDLGFRKIERSLDKLSGTATLATGVQGDQDSRVVQYATHNEYGTESVPQRSFLRSTFDEREREMRIHLQRAIKQATRGQLPANNVLPVVALFFEQKVRDKIRSNINPPNSPATIAKKLSKTVASAKGAKRHRAVAALAGARSGSAPPTGAVSTLIDTGRLINSIRTAKLK